LYDIINYPTQPSFFVFKNLSTDRIRT